jgi:hypothetical protein
MRKLELFNGILDQVREALAVSLWLRRRDTSKTKGRTKPAVCKHRKPPQGSAFISTYNHPSAAAAPGTPVAYR